MEYEKIGIELGDNSLLDLELIKLLQNNNIKFDINTICDVDLIVLDFLTYCRKVKENSKLKSILESDNYFFKVDLVRGNEVIEEGNFNSILYNNNFNVIFNRSFTKLVYRKSAYTSEHILMADLKRFIPNFKYFYPTFSSEFQNGLYESLIKGFFSENPEFESYLQEFYKIN